MIKKINGHFNTGSTKKKKSGEVRSTSIFEDKSGNKKRNGNRKFVPADGQCCHEDGGRYAIFERSTEVYLKIEYMSVIFDYTQHLHTVCR